MHDQIGKNYLQGFDWSIVTWVTLNSVVSSRTVYIATVILKLKQLNTFFLCYQFLASERHNLHDDLCLIDPPVISSDGEPQLNVLPYDSDEFNNKINK